MIINCKECGREISDTAKVCPHCGAKVKKEKAKLDSVNKLGSILSNLSNKVKDSKNGKIIYLGSLISSCAVALCFFILTIISFAAPYAFLHSEPCTDGYALIDELAIKNQNRYDVNIRGDNYSILRYKLGNKIVISVGYGSSGAAVQYHFAKDGSINAYAFFNGYECDYEFKDTYFSFVEAFYNYKLTSLSGTNRKLADTAIELSEAVFDYVLAINGKSYDFYDILKDYNSYRNSIQGIRISSTFLMSVFTIVSVCGVAFYVQFIRKKEQAVGLQEDEITDNN